MAVPQVNHPAYIIYRDVPVGESYDATSPLSFFPPKGSDELFDALRETFPHLKTHSERMRDAIIQFLLEERQGEQFELSPATTMESSQLTLPSVSSGSVSNFSSPDLLNFATPASFTNSPLIQHLPTTTSNQSSPPSLDQMTGVFSLSSNPQPKQRVRRKMTEAEKIEYRKRRIVKACEKCAKRKRKCPHNQAEMRTIPTSSTKSTPPLLASPAEPLRRQPDPYLPMAFEESFDPYTFGSFGDFNMFDDSLPEVSVDDFFHFEHFEGTSPLFSNVNQGHGHVPGRPAQTLHEYGAPVNIARDLSIVQPSQSSHSYYGLEGQSAENSSSSPSDRSVASQSESQSESEQRIQTHPLQQRAVRDPRTGDSFSQAGMSNVSVDSQPRRMNNPLGSESMDQLGVQRAIRATDNRCCDTLSDSALPRDLRRHRSRPPRSFSDQETALISTPMSTHSPIPRPATLQGRPQPPGLPDGNSTSATQVPEDGEGVRPQVSLGEGIHRTDSLASELFMLRRRLPQTQNRHMKSHGNRESITDVSAKPKHVKPTSRGHQSPEQLSAQANGGAYLRLGPESTESTHTSRRTYRGGRAGVRDAALVQDVARISAAPSMTVVQQDRLSDHVRFRDHHGRLPVREQGYGFPQLITTLGAFMLLASFSPGLFTLGLAFFFMKHYMPETAGISEDIVQCTTKNSSWLSARASHDTSDELGFRVLKARQYLRCSGSQVGVSLFEGGSGAWLMGLMYPFKLSPLSFAAV